MKTSLTFAAKALLFALLIGGYFTSQGGQPTVLGPAISNVSLGTITSTPTGAHVNVMDGIDGTKWDAPSTTSTLTIKWATTSTITGAYITSVKATDIVKVEFFRSIASDTWYSGAAAVPSSTDGKTFIVTGLIDGLACNGIRVTVTSSTSTKASINDIFLYGSLPAEETLGKLRVYGASYTYGNSYNYGNLNNYGSVLNYEHVSFSKSIYISGSVGIGTTTGGNYGTCKLAVEGKIGAREVVVTLATAWPDYVFENSYKLPSLKEVSDYIKINKHLPEVPSACTVEDNGVNLGEMNALLLKKVEELTLYLIDQNNQIKELKGQSEIQMKQIEILQTAKR